METFWRVCSWSWLAIASMLYAHDLCYMLAFQPESAMLDLLLHLGHKLGVGNVTVIGVWFTPWVAFGFFRLMAWLDAYGKRGWSVFVLLPPATSHLMLLPSRGEQHELKCAAMAIADMCFDPAPRILPKPRKKRIHRIRFRKAA